MHRLLVAALIVVVSLAGPALARTRPQPVDVYPGYQSAVYADPAHWLCRPDKSDVCDRDLDATSIKANGKTRVEPFRPARSPSIDCFYVYPTISTDRGGNSDLVPGDDQELFVVRQQAARLGSVCRVFAPVYRQATLTALVANLGGTTVIPVDRALGYNDVVDAWKHYIANDNGGRGVVLIGHSQGAFVLTALLQNEIDPNPELRARLVSAMLLGTSFQVPEGRDVGGDLANIPLCRKPRQTGCVVSYATFRATAPPPSNSFFGGSERPGWTAACTNPAALRGGKGVLHPYLPTDARSLPILPLPAPPEWVDPAKGVRVATPFVTLPRWVEAECAQRDGFTYLAVSLQGDASDERIDDLRGADLTPEWGLHLIDANIAMGDLVALARDQAHGFCASKRRCAKGR